MRLYKQYLCEREHVEIMEDPLGFATYRMDDAETVYIQDIYVVPAARKSGVASQLAERILKQTQAKRLIGSVDPLAAGAHESLLVLLAYGMKISHIEGSLLFMIKDVV